MEVYICPDCGAKLVDGVDIRGRCYVCPYCGAEECDLSRLKRMKGSNNGD